MRPAMYPPALVETIAVNANHRSAPVPTVRGAIPSLDQGEMEDRPVPAPRASNIRETAMVVIAPAAIALHETAGVRASVLAELYRTLKGVASELTLGTSRIIIRSSIHSNLQPQSA